MFDIMKMRNAIHECLKAMDGFNGSEFMSVICTMMEVVCEANGLDVVEMAEDIVSAVRDVNNNFGKYTKEG